MARQSRAKAVAIVCVGIALTSSMQAFTTLPSSTRAAHRVARRAVKGEPGPSGKTVETPEVNFFVAQQIVDCLTEGCPLTEINELEAKLARDEKRVEASIVDLRAELEEKHTHEAADKLAALRNFLGDSVELREQLEMVKGIKSNFEAHLAGAMPFGHGSTAGLLKRGVGIVQPHTDFVTASHPGRTKPRVVLHAVKDDEAAFPPEKPTKHLDLPEVNFFVNQQIKGCLMEGCSVEEIEELEAKLGRDEARIEAVIKELRVEMEQEHSHDAAEWLHLLRNFLGDSQELREQLEQVRNIKQSFFKHLIGAVGALPVGHGTTGGLLERGVGIVGAVRPRAGEFVAASHQKRPHPKVTRHYGEDDAIVGDIYDFVNRQIRDCVEEGCSVDKLQELEADLVRDEARVDNVIKELKDLDEQEHSPEAAVRLHLLGNLFGESQELHERLEQVRGMKKVFADSEVDKL